ncbi:MAG: glycosyltransferase family 4 protein [Thermodesulfobacteriota bacterium]|nr:glycosyltransferase family 4 protein [Thermodesulfobacteriota bacterium]
MKIALLSYRGNPYCGGQGIYLTYLANELVKLGHEVHVIVGPPWPLFLKGAFVHRVENFNFFGKKKDFLPPANPFKIFSPLNFYEFSASRFGVFPEIKAFSFRAFFKLLELARTHSFDILHDNQCLGYGMLLWKLLGVPVVSTLHHPLSIDRATWFEQPADLKQKVKRVLYYPLIMQRIVSNRLDRIITVSHDSAREITRAFGVAPEKIRVVYNGLDNREFAPLPGLSKKPKSLIFVGNSEDRKKGLLYLLQAMTYLPKDVTLTVVDGGAPQRSFAPPLTDKYHIGHRVHFTGKIDPGDLVRLYCGAEVAVVPSLYEGFGFPAAEAMACELPVVASTAGALPEVVGNDGAGILVPPRNATALAQAITRLLKDPALRQGMGQAARRRVLRLFTWENAARQMVEVYKETIHAHR